MSTENKDEEAIFYAALKLKSQAERNAYIKAACGNDINLLNRVEALLKAHDAQDSFLEAPAIGPDATLDEPLSIEGPGTKIGRYELLELIGEGGMGLVYLAQQKEPVKRRVALKIVKLGMDTKQVVARFEAERQTLALLEHPNIAHVFDAGTTETGRPYFVMEYVKGMSITKFCDKQKLNVGERLELFRQACEGVHHAHQKGIIHRDIKPSNILVSIHGDKAIPEIIDFGIAKAITQPLTEKTSYTEQGQLLGTPEYMSPEQAEMTCQNVDTRSDIYSLGVVLYELLAGVPPFDAERLREGGIDHIQQVICEEQPVTPSARLTSLGDKANAVAQSRRTQIITLTRCLHRELEWIPMKAMRKDRTRRYRSASELADDIQNYLTGTPLIAGPESAVYRTRKFVRKHAGSVAMVALIAIAIIIGLVASIVMGCRAERARQQEALAREKEAAARKQVEQALVRAENAEKAAEEKSEELRRTLYVNSIQLADAKYREANIRRVRELLDACPEDLRGWEWYRLRHISDLSRMTLRGHKEHVNSVALSPDGKRIISGSNDKTIKVWDAETDTELMTLRGHSNKVWSVAFSPDGKRIVSGSVDKTIKIWDAATGIELMTLRGHGQATHVVAFSPDGKCIVSGSADNTIKVWDAATGTELMTLRGHNDRVISVAFSPDGKCIVSGSGDRTIKIWDAATGAELMTLRGHDGWIDSIAFSPDGERIVSGSDDRTIKIWDAATGAELMALRGHGNWVGPVAFSPDGKRIISGSGDNTIKVWDAATGVELMTLRGHGDEVSSIAFSPDSKRIVSGSGDETIKVWDAAIRAKAVTLSGHQDRVRSIAFSPDSKQIVSGSSDNTIKVWDAATGTEVMTLHDDYSYEDALFSPDGKRIISGGYDEKIKVWDAATGAELMTFPVHDHWVVSIDISPDGKRIVSGSPVSTIKVWDSATGDELMTLRGHTECVKSVAFGPDGKRIVSGSDDKTIKIWDAATSNELRTLRGHSDKVWSVAFSPNGKQIVSGSSDRTVKVWNVENGIEVMTLRGHRNWVMPVAFSPDGKRIISGSGDNTIKVWDSATGTELMTLGVVDNPASIAFSPDGKTIAVGTYDYNNNIQLWESATPAGGYEPRWKLQAMRQVADELVDELYKETGFNSEVIDKLNADKTLAEPVRKVALQVANARLWEEAKKLERESFKVVRLPGGQIEVYRLALGKAEMANRLEPNNPDILIILGLAQYRVGAYQDVLTTLTECENWRPGPFIFKGMALYQLGRAAEARAALNRAHALLEDWLFDAVSVVRPFVMEAEKLLAGEGTKLYSLWEAIEEGRGKESVQMIEELQSSKDAETTARMEGAVMWIGRGCYNYAKTKMSGGEFAEAISYFEAAVRIDPNRALAFNDLAWLRATCVVAEFRDGAKAVEEATRACELMNFKKAHYVGTLAAAYAEAGDFDSAVKRQREAMDLLTEQEEELRGDFEERLRLYQSGKPYRESP
ncbi:MAG: protein kinase domain-containing protein [Planctomycetota bacterium]|jgi:WD40 repeat protein/tRNA A-37 threonylcarbamoyl transferase component Bud32/Flp pilus assembly protein TadD